MTDNPNAPIYCCASCGERYRSKAIYCKDCRTAEQRKAISEANRKIHEENAAKATVAA